jgi:hypothetical protein
MTMERHGEAYARWLALGARVGFAALVVSFFIYLGGLIAPGIPTAELPRYWGLPVAEYLAATHAPTGWSWVQRLPQSDVLNFVGVAILGFTSIACYLRLIVDYIRERDWLYLAICVAQIAVLSIAASGLLAG